MSHEGFEFERVLPDGTPVHVTITEWQPAEPDVGIMSGGPTDLKVVNVETGEDISDSISEDMFEDLCIKGAELAAERAATYDDDEL